MSTLARTSSAIFQTPSCALNPEPNVGTCGPPTMRFLGKRESKDPEFQKQYLNLKLIDEEPTRVMPNEMEKLVSELPRNRGAFPNESATNV
jgi:hypothetical protein